MNKIWPIAHTHCFLGLSGVALTAMLFIGCGQQADSPRLPTPPAELHILNWADYITQSTLEEYGRRRNCEVILHAYNSTDEMLSMLKSNPANYDIVVVEDRLIEDMAELKLIQKFNPNTLQGYENLDPEMINLPSDPGNQYSIPYNWGTTLLVYRADRLTPEASWSSLFDPQWAKEVLMLDISQECYAIALRSLGQSINSTDPQWLKQATALLKQQAENIQGYSDIYRIKEALLEGSCSLAPLYSGDAAEIANRDPNIHYLIPKEGAPMWIDGFTISRDAPNVELAKGFIEFMLEPEVAAANASALWYASANKAAKAHMAREILEDESLYPPERIQSRLEFLNPMNTSLRAILNKNWKAIKDLNRQNQGVTE